MHAKSGHVVEERKLVQDEGWAELRSRLPADVEDRARRSGALRRARKVRSGDQLLRLILVYVGGWLSLRETATWAERALGLELTDSALDYRFGCAAVFVRELVQSLLDEQLGRRASQGPAVRLLDGTGLNEPGSRGTDWRRHVTYSPGGDGVVGLELTDAHGAEHLARGAGRPGDLFIADRGYGHPREVRTARANGQEALLRVHLQSLAVQDGQGRRLTPSMLLKRAERGVFDQVVWLPERGQAPSEARLLVARLPKEQAARARQRLRQTAAKEGRVPSALTLRLAGFFCGVTTLSAERAPVATLLRWYRVRWQVELWIKRSKSLLGLDRLTQASPVMVAIQVWGRLLLALLVQRLGPPPSERRGAPGQPPVSEWRLTRVHWLDVVLAIYGGTALATRLACIHALDRLRERPRRKRTWASALAEEIEQTLASKAPSPVAL